MSTTENNPGVPESPDQAAEAVEALADGSVATMAESVEAAEQEPVPEGQPVAPEDTEDGEETVDETLMAEAEAELAEEPEPELPPLGDDARRALGQALFALLFASPDTLTLGRLKDLTESPTAHVRDGLEEVERLIEASDLPLVLRNIAGGFRLFSAPEVAEVVARLAKVRKAEQVTPAALETLSIVAYRQPVTKAEVEAIRGVQAGPMLRQLIDRGLVKVPGRADQPGSPLLYATTKDFLDRFGLARLKDLPRDAELK